MNNDDDDEACPTCGEGNNVPAIGTWRCPTCDAEWPDEKGDEIIRLRKALSDLQDDIAYWRNKINE